VGDATVAAFIVCELWKITEKKKYTIIIKCKIIASLQCSIYIDCKKSVELLLI